MSRLHSYKIEYANFLCHFGEQVLLDRYLDIFYPAITSGCKRTYSDTFYKFIDVKHLEIENPETLEKDYFLYGKIVKDFVYRREQLLDDDESGVVEDHDELRDSPSSTFILSLQDHRLYFIKEFTLAPTLANFKLLVEHLIKNKTHEIINEIYEQKKEMNRLKGGTTKVPSKKSLKINYPDPTIEIVKLSSPEGIDEFIKSMKSVNRFELKINKTNHESDLSSLFTVLRDQNKEMGPDSKNTLVYTKGKSSLNHEKVIELAKAASEDNNVNFFVKGDAIEGGPLSGTEEDFDIKMPISEIEKTPEAMALKAHRTFWQLIKDGIVKQPRVDNIKLVKQKIQNIIELLGVWNSKK